MLMYLERENEHVHEQGKGRERERERERVPSRLQAFGMEPDVGLELTNPEIVT